MIYQKSIFSYIWSGDYSLSLSNILLTTEQFTQFGHTGMYPYVQNPQQFLNLKILI